ncbi:Ig-like domain-containing protein [Streptomyces yangpuensis]|uniref:Ig-like domain-containing protein n=1 Tax=Streptomyces yangpuensis TaxID=1648182 RepID=A0ABY5PQK7_9ACTN|nr:Ig-like domain-containing protein [Streptomyces yangpuensis]UUY46202.1 Ig-like domain-containing protein [Streptomyces yangpuensis]
MAAVTGAMLVVAAAPGRAPDATSSDTTPAGHAREAAVTLLVGRVLEGSRGAGEGRCAARVLQPGLCDGWQEQRVRATARGVGSVLKEPAFADAAWAEVRPTDAGGPLEITLGEPGRITDVTVRDGHGRHLAGALGPHNDRWLNTESLRAGETYTVQVGAQDAAGSPVGVTMAFRTAPPADGGRLTVEFGPGPGTYGAGEIVTAALSRPVPADDPVARARLEQALEVTSEPHVEGAWHWVDASTLHFRPRTYWPAHTVVRVRSGLDGVEVGDQAYGGPSEDLQFTIGDRIEAVTDSATHRMTVRRNGRVIRTIPVTTGKEGFRTRSGIKVVLRKESKVRMRGDTVGIKRGTKEFYDLPVSYATRVTWSGEYIHAAPWSVEAQGEENVSHGCTGMSTENAAWFFDTVREGDIVEVVNSGGEKMAPFSNGFGDWNVDWRSWLAGSALADVDAAPPGSPLTPSRLHPTT